METGMIVRDRDGTRKYILREEGENVVWRYADSAANRSPESEEVTPYSEFADSHFVLPRSGRGQRADPMATENRSKQVHAEVVYLAPHGDRIRVAACGEDFVAWESLEGNRRGETSLEEFLENYRPEGKVA